MTYEELSINSYLNNIQTLSLMQQLSQTEPQACHWILGWSKAKNIEVMQRSKVTTRPAAAGVEVMIKLMNARSRTDNTTNPVNPHTDTRRVWYVCLGILICRRTVIRSYKSTCYLLHPFHHIGWVGQPIQDDGDTECVDNQDWVRWWTAGIDTRLGLDTNSARNSSGTSGEANIYTSKLKKSGHKLDETNIFLVKCHHLHFLIVLPMTVIPQIMNNKQETDPRREPP